ncbi:hypothetical protein H9643_01230 [Ochrobactrum sp. Sa2BUA5]|nr:hypothetical protein [Ochrobactrum gallinarum]
MYKLKPGIKRDPQRRWALSDRVFFGNGACHILAGAYLLRPPLAGFYAERLIPGEGFAGNHVFVTNGRIAFDYHGYSDRIRLLQYLTRAWSKRYSDGWNGCLEKVDFDLLDTDDLNERKMLGPDQYLGDSIARAYRFMERIDHRVAAQKADSTIQKN